METPMIDSPNEPSQPDRESLVKQLKDIESRIQDFEREREKILKEDIAPDERIQLEWLRLYVATKSEFGKEELMKMLRDQVLLFFFNIHNNLPEHKKTDPTSTKRLLKEIEFRVQDLCKMLERLKIEEELEGLKKERDKIKSDLANLNHQNKLGFHPKRAKN